LKKIILGLTFLVLLVAVIYVQVTRDSSHRDDIRKSAYEEGLSESVDQLSKADSLSDLLAKQVAAAEDSLSKMNLSYDSQSDSLYGVIEAQKEQLAELRKQNQTLKESAPSSKKSKSGKDRDSEILGYYKSEIRQLPGDLSTYEKRVAISEIRQETARKFSMTVEQLNKLRQQHNLDN